MKLQFGTHLEVTNLFSLIVMRLAFGSDGVGGVTSQLALAEWGKLRVWERWSWCVLADC